MSRKLLAHLPDKRDTCGCSLDDGRCDKHATMMQEIHAFWRNSRNNALMHHIWCMNDAYGVPGYELIGTEAAYDWSGIRESSCDVIEEMYQAIHA